MPVFSILISLAALMLGIINFLWLLHYQRPRLRMQPGLSRFFNAKKTADLPIRTDPQDVTILSSVLTVSNNSSRNNSLVSIEPRVTGHEFSLPSPAASYLFGTRKVMLPYFRGGEDVTELAECWQVPLPHFVDAVPCHIPAGDHRIFNLSLEMDGLTRKDTVVLLRIKAEDAFGRTYKLKVFFSHGAPTSENVSLVGEAEGTSGA